VIQFVIDESVKKSIEISRLIDQAMATSPKPKPPDELGTEDTLQD
jgi:hypothetical protein